MKSPTMQSDLLQGPMAGCSAAFIPHSDATAPVPGEVLCEVHTQKLHSSTADGQWRVLDEGSPEADYNLFCFLHIEGEIVASWLSLSL